MSDWQLIAFAILGSILLAGMVAALYDACGDCIEQVGATLRDRVDS